MDIATSTQLFNQVASTTGQFISDSFPIWILYFGTGLALILIGSIILAITRTVKNL